MSEARKNMNKALESKRTSQHYQPGQVAWAYNCVRAKRMDDKFSMSPIGLDFGDCWSEKNVSWGIRTYRGQVKFVHVAVMQPYTAGLMSVSPTPGPKGGIMYV